jgi:hypothetical protein
VAETADLSGQVERYLLSIGVTGKQIGTIRELLVEHG